MACYLYYEGAGLSYDGAPSLPFSDEKFGLLCKKILRNWDAITHPDKYLLSKEALQAETGSEIRYTNMIKWAAK